MRKVQKTLQLSPEVIVMVQEYQKLYGIRSFQAALELLAVKGIKSELPLTEEKE